MTTEVEKLDFDPYELLEVGEEAQEKELVKAFRKKALKWHPDKNPDRKEYAQAMFLKISKAFEILTDASVKAAYDRLKRARKAAKERTRHLDQRRKKFKEQLESREAGVQVQKEDEQLAAKRLQREIERLRKEGSKLLQKEREEVEREVHEQARMEHDKRQSRLEPESCSADTKTTTSSPSRVRIRWKADKNDLENGGYNEQVLKNVFSKYGEISALVISVKKKGSALIEFGRLENNSDVSAIDLEKGLEDNPLTVTWVSGKPGLTNAASKLFVRHQNGNSSTDDGKQAESIRETLDGSAGTGSVTGASSFPENNSTFGKDERTAGLCSDRDFESIVLTKLRQAEERKRLIEELKQTDNQGEETIVLD